MLSWNCCGLFEIIRKRIRRKMIVRWENSIIQVTKAKIFVLIKSITDDSSRVDAIYGTTTKKNQKRLITTSLWAVCVFVWSHDAPHKRTLSLHNQQADDQLLRLCFERMIYFSITDANGLLLSFILGAYSLVKLLWLCG